MKKTGVTDSVSTPAPAPPITSDLLGRYIGLRHDTLPAVVRGLGSTLIHIGSAEYSISHVRANDVDMLWLDSMVPGKTASPTKIIRAVLRLPPLGPDERLFMASCDVNGSLDSRVVAVVVNEPGAAKFTKVRQAWRADADRGRFDVIPIAGITCEDPGSG